MLNLNLNTKRGFGSVGVIIIILLVLGCLGVGYIIYYQRVYYPTKVQNCFKIAIGLERERHSNLVGITIEDISEYLKNMDSCLSYH